MPLCDSDFGGGPTPASGGGQCFSHRMGQYGAGAVLPRCQTAIGRSAAAPLKKSAPLPLPEAPWNEQRARATVGTGMQQQLLLLLVLGGAWGRGEGGRTCGVEAVYSWGLQLQLRFERKGLILAGRKGLGGTGHSQRNGSVLMGRVCSSGKGSCS